MESELCPPILGLELEPGYKLSSFNRTVHSVVSVLCHNVTAAVLRCMPSRKWNDTRPSCGPDVAMEAGDEMQVETIIIIVWVLGGVLLLALLVLLAVIITSHKKVVRSNAQSSRSNIFTVSATSSNRNSRGGDNPAFTSENETAGMQRNGGNRSSMRPPSYHEAVTGQVLVLPGYAVRSAAQGRSSNPRREINSPRGRREERSAQGGAARGRYVYDYPTCYWEEEPPPPYSLVVGDRPEPSLRVPPPPTSRPPASPSVPRPPQHASPDAARIHRVDRNRPHTASAPLARLEYDHF